MMNNLSYKIVIFIFAVFSFFISQSQIINTINSNERLPETFKKALSGVQFVNMYEGETYLNFITSNPNSLDAQILLGFVTFLNKDLGFPYVAITNDQLKDLESISNSTCDFVKVDLNAQFVSDLLAVGRITDIVATFQFCDNSIFSLKLADYGVNGLTNHSKKFRNAFKERIPFSINYDSLETKSILVLPIIAKEDSLKSIIQQDTVNSEFVGIYHYFNGGETHLEKVAVVADSTGLILVYLSGKGKNAKDWVEGELKGYLIRTSSPNDFLLRIYLQDKTEAKGSLSFNKGAMIIYFDNKEFKFLK